MVDQTWRKLACSDLVYRTYFNDFLAQDIVKAYFNKTHAQDVVYIYKFQLWGAGGRVGVPRLETHMSKGVAHVRNKRPKHSLHEKGKKKFLTRAIPNDY